MIGDLEAIALLGGLVLVGLVTGAEFGDPIRRGLRRLGRALMPAAGAHTGPLREVAASAQQGPGPRPENAGPGGAVPAVAGSGTAPEPPPVPGFRQSADMSTGELQLLDARVDALSRPVNGVSRGTQPRQQPVPYTELSSKFGDRPGPELLGRVLSGLHAMRAPVYGQAPQLEVERALGRADLGPADRLDRTFAERVIA